MLKSEALEQLSAIADDDNRDFEDFAAAYKTMEEVVKEYPELSHYVLPIVVQTAADKGFNADIRPAAARVFNAAALNLPAEDVVKNVVRAFKRCPPFAYYLMPDLLSGRPELSAALFPEAEAGLAKIEANCVYSAAAAAKAALLCASDREAAAMLDSAFRPAKEKEDFSRVLYRSLGQIYSRHPALKEQIFSLLETPRLLKPQNYDAFYSNLGQIGLFDAGERGRVIGLLSSYLQKGGNTPASLTAAYKAVGEMMAAADDKRELETVMRTGLQNAANDTVSRKTAWRLLGDYDNLCSRVSFCRRVEKSADNEFGLQRVETIDAGELGVLLLGGDGTRSEKALNGYLGDVYRLLKEHGLHEKAAVYGVVYDFGDFMNVGFARRRQMEKYGRNIRIDRDGSEVCRGNFRQVSFAADFNRPRPTASERGRGGFARPAFKHRCSLSRRLYGTQAGRDDAGENERTGLYAGRAAAGAETAADNGAVAVLSARSVAVDVCVFCFGFG